ncbi:MAG: TetR/AcrR family transcriptional regulator [bacterium]|nr:TetR/AcrR family transcriptional regulator [bacterium]MDT8366490.1 TetR/AcrR family transcriptional regulator [bacterium]
MSKKEAILKAATELFARKGYNRTAVSEIASQADVAQGTVFHHFKSKEKLLISICDELVTEYISGVRKTAAGPGTGWEALERVLYFSQRFKKEHYESIVVASRETWSLDREDKDLHKYFCGLMGQIIEIKSECIERGIADGSIREVPAYITALLIHILLSGIVHIQTQGLLPLPDLDTEIVQFCSRSLCTAEMSEKEQLKNTGGRSHVS